MAHDTYEVGMYIRNALKPEWGYGRILEVQSDVVVVCFRNAEEPKRINVEAASLQTVDPEKEARFDLPQRFRHKWRFLPPCSKPRSANPAMAEHFDSRKLTLRPSAEHGGTIESKSHEFCGTCDRCEGEGYRLYLLEDVQTGDLLQFGPECRKKALGNDS